MTNTDDARIEDSITEDDEHVKDVPDGCGCAEMWEHLSDQRSEEGDR
ncbi:MAG: hypothetical protein ABEI52_12025 [Halobacteriaceae archaeon]